MPVVSLREFFYDLGHSSLNSSSAPRGVITFDDGYRDVWIYARPILKEFSILPTFFICTNPLFKDVPLIYDRLISSVPWKEDRELDIKGLQGEDLFLRLRTLKEKEDFVKEATRLLMGLNPKDQDVFLNRFEGYQKKEAIRRATRGLYLSPEEVKQARDEGFEIGSHTASHPNVRLLSRDRWAEEIKGSKEELEALLGEEVPFFSYPAGQYNSEVGAYIREVGYQGALITGKKVIFDSPGDRYALPRISPEGIVSLGKFYAQVGAIRPDWFR